LRVIFRVGQLKEKCNFVNYVFYCYVYVLLLLFIYSNCYTRSVLCIVSLYCPVYCLCVNMCTVLLSPGVEPIAVNKYISHINFIDIVKLRK